MYKSLENTRLGNMSEGDSTAGHELLCKLLKVLGQVPVTQSICRLCELLTQCVAHAEGDVADSHEEPDLTGHYLKEWIQPMSSLEYSNSSG